ncbi:MAG: biotin/lipoyl-binding protein [Propionibacteriaceae bacterium]|jgi:biotin carboxyl carrier protein|nr:biotin/lipoyl-binding protein [Propionibacteriaceae bacterium]
MKLKVTVNSVPYEVDVEVVKENPALGAVVIGGGGGPAPAAPAAGGGSAAGGAGIPAPLAGTVLRIPVEVGQAVKAGDVVLVLEAMKMETEINSPSDGTIKSINVEVGQAVQVGQGLIEVE